MAERLERFPAAQRPPTRRYPWDEWTDGSVWRLVRGEDFDQECDQFRNRLYPQATKRGLKVRSAKRVERATKDGQRLEREILVIEFYSPNGARGGPQADKDFHSEHSNGGDPEAAAVPDAEQTAV